LRDEDIARESTGKEENMQLMSLIKAISLDNASSFSPSVTKGLIGILLIVLCSTYDVRAQPGELDTSFSFDGKVTIGFGVGSNDSAEAIIIQLDGKIVAAGRSDAGGSFDFALARYNTDGSVDSGFGNDGLVVTDFSGSGNIDEAYALSIQSDGKIVAAGRSDAGGSFDFALARYNTDGSLDSGFGNDGLVLTDFSGFGSYDEAYALSIQSDGKIVAAGRSDAGGSSNFALARYNTDGSLDSGFGNDGLVLTDFSGSGNIDEAYALSIQSDGKIVAAGASDAGGSFDFALARYNADGSLDSGFGNDGLVLTDFSDSESIDDAFALSIQSDGKIVAAGHSGAIGSFDFALARFLPSPTPPPGAFQPGDANADGVINILDVTAILNDILGLSPAPGNGDCNEDGQVNILDVTCVLNIILGPLS
jgi:uncharacterized delta-60 repeat protein